MIFLAMVFMHILDDFCLQGILASMKQKEWWKKQEGYNDMYKRDYIVALFMHSFSWAFMVMLPIAIKDGFNESWLFFCFFVLNLITHIVVDDLKANKKKINLIADQGIHLMQIGVTALVLG